MTKPINLWSGPRNVSTALMYSFAQRDDIRVVDEPLYGHYLRVSGAAHPGREDVIRAMNCDGNAVIRELFVEQRAQPRRLFLKHMAHHLVELDLGFLQQSTNIFLIRDPAEMLPSLTIQIPQAQLRDTGLEQQWKLFKDLRDCPDPPAVLDSRQLLLDPQGVLEQLCKHIELPFRDDMLSWEAGPREEDGVWAPHWYHNVHRSTGFAPYTAKREFPGHLEELLAQCSPFYDKLYASAIRSNVEETQ